MEDYKTFLCEDHDLYLANRAQIFWDSGLKLDWIKQHMKDHGFPTETSHFYWHRDALWHYERFLSDMFFHPDRKLYDISTGQILDTLKKMSFTDFLDGMGVREEIAEEFCKRVSPDKPEEYLGALLWVFHMKFIEAMRKITKDESWGSDIYSTTPPTNLISYVWTGRGSSMSRASEYLIDYYHLKTLLFANKVDEIKKLEWTTSYHWKTIVRHFDNNQLEKAQEYFTKTFGDIY